MPASTSSPAAAVAVELPSPAPVTETVPLVLEITRGRTRFRSRPVSGPRFLIGAGVTCDLRLGGAGVPVLHSLITFTNGEVHLEAIAPAPVLIVNGRGVRETELNDGDVIGIGDVEFRARLAVGHTPTAIQASDTTEAVVDAEVEQLSDLSAAELVDRIEAEEQQVEEFENRRLMGAKALTQNVFSRVARMPGSMPREANRPHSVPAPHFLSKRPQVLAARGRTRPVAIETVPNADDSEFLEEIEQLGRQLTELSQELQSSSQRSNAREMSYAEATELLMQTQEKLASQLETLVSQVSIIQQQPAASKPRAIA
jgi:hypothetical protein